MLGDDLRQNETIVSRIAIDPENGEQDQLVRMSITVIVAPAATDIDVQNSWEHDGTAVMLSILQIVWWYIAFRKTTSLISHMQPLVPDHCTAVQCASSCTPSTATAAYMSECWRYHDPICCLSA